MDFRTSALPGTPQFGNPQLNVPALRNAWLEASPEEFDAVSPCDIDMHPINNRAIDCPRPVPQHQECAPHQITPIPPVAKGSYERQRRAAQKRDRKMCIDAGIQSFQSKTTKLDLYLLVLPIVAVTLRFFRNKWLGMIPFQIEKRRFAEKLTAYKLERMARLRELFGRAIYAVACALEHPTAPSGKND